MARLPSACCEAFWGISRPFWRAKGSLNHISAQAQYVIVVQSKEPNERFIDFVWEITFSSKYARIINNYWMRLGKKS